MARRDPDATAPEPRPKLVPLSAKRENVCRFIDVGYPVVDGRSTR